MITPYQLNSFEGQLIDNTMLFIRYSNDRVVQMQVYVNGSTLVKVMGLWNVIENLITEIGN